MKRLLAITLLTISTFASAVTPEAKHECELTSNLAAVIMEARQADVPIYKMREMSESKLEEMLIAAAYVKPIYGAEENKEKIQRKIILDFKSEIYSKCLQNNNNPIMYILM